MGKHIHAVKVCPKDREAFHRLLPVDCTMHPTHGKVVKCLLLLAKTVHAQWTFKA
jgi:hypothetical protein